MKIDTEATNCGFCSILLPHDDANIASSDSHSCLQTLMHCVKKNSYTIRDQEETIRSQNILLAKLIRELEEVKQILNEKGNEISSMKESMEKVILNQACIIVEPEHKGLIDKLKQDGFITTDKVYQIMLSVDFRDFSQDSVTPNKSYQINKAKFFEKYVQRVQEGSRVLYMFSNPYVAVCLAMIVGSKGIVVTEGDEYTVTQIRKNYDHLIDSERLVVIDGKWSDFLAKGCKVRSPYDVIIVPKHYYSKYVESQLDTNGTAYDPWDDTRLNEDTTAF